MLGILTLDGERVPVTIPVNSELSVAGPGPNQQVDGLRPAEWNSRRLMVFVQDLENRATPLEPGASSQPPL